MSAPESEGGGREVAAFQTGDYTTAMTPQERELGQRILVNTVDWPSETWTAIEDRIRQYLTVGNISGLMAKVMPEVLSTVFPTGFIRWVPEDLTAQTGLYVWAGDATGDWLYMNGATITGTYQDLIDYLGTSTMPDTRGRPLWAVGTNAALDLFDNDGVAEASRTPNQTDSISISGTSGAGTSHSHGAGSYAVSLPNDFSSFAEGALGTPGSGSVSVTGTSGTEAAHTHSFSDTDTANIQVPHIALGSVLIRP